MRDNIRSRRRGITLWYAIFMMSAMCLILSLAIDYARVQLAKTELMRAADAAARAACSNVPSDLTAARALANQFANYNTADGTTVSLVASDIRFGKWNDSTRQFEELTGLALSSADSVEVTARRSTDTSNAIPLLMPRAFGLASINIHSTVVARVIGAPAGYGIVGLDFVSMSGNGLIDSYRSTDGPYNSSTRRNYGNVASNGDISLSGSTGINGNANPGVGHNVIGKNGVPVTGSTLPLTTPLDESAPTAGNAQYANNDGQVNSKYVTSGSFDLGNKTTTLSNGTYYFNNFSTGANSVLNISGAVTIYLTGNLSLGGGASVYQNSAQNLKIIMVNPNTTATFTGNSDIYVDLYAPLTAVTITGTGDFYGRVIGKSVTMQGNGQSHVDETLIGPSTQRIVSMK